MFNKLIIKLLQSLRALSSDFSEPIFWLRHSCMLVFHQILLKNLCLLMEIFWWSMRGNQPAYVEMIFQQLCTTSTPASCGAPCEPYSRKISKFINRELILKELYDFEILSKVCKCFLWHLSYLILGEKWLQ